MKTLAYATALTALTVVGAHAQTAYEARSATSTETVDGVTQTVETQYVSSTTVMPVDGVIGDAPATPAELSDKSVKVKLPNGDVIDIADSDEAPWNKDSRLQGYDRFTFDPVSGAMVAGKGDAKFENNWDENGNRIVKKPAPAPKKAKKKVEAKVEEPVAEEAAPAVETPAAEVPASDASTGDVPTPESISKPAVEPQVQPQVQPVSPTTAK